MIINHKGHYTNPRLSIFCSNKHIYIQVIDDINNKTLFFISTLKLKNKKNLIFYIINNLIKNLLKFGIKKLNFNKKNKIHFCGRIKKVITTLNKFNLII
jgi:large subunit ribosomal protein L18